MVQTTKCEVLPSDRSQELHISSLLLHIKIVASRVSHANGVPHCGDVGSSVGTKQGKGGWKVSLQSGHRTGEAQLLMLTLFLILETPRQRFVWLISQKQEKGRCWCFCHFSLLFISSSPLPPPPDKISISKFFCGSYQ